MTFINPLVVKLDYGKVSASDLSDLEIALWYFGAARDDLRYRPVGLSESTWISILLWIQFEALFSFETVDEYS